LLPRELSLGDADRTGVPSGAVMMDRRCRHKDEEGTRRYGTGYAIPTEVRPMICSRHALASAFRRIPPQAISPRSILCWRGQTEMMESTPKARRAPRTNPYYRLPTRALLGQEGKQRRDSHEQETGLPVRGSYECLQALSDRKSPDYRNSVKESISAVEAACNLLTRVRRATSMRLLDN
jgi:hypothetical protein